MALYHASCVVFQKKGLLIFGPSGSGKSDLALRLIDHGATLVCDDYVSVEMNGGRLIASTAPNIEGLIEVRGVGLMKCDYVESNELHYAIELCDRNKIERLPEPKFFEHENVKIPLYKFDAFASSAIAKIKMILK